MNKEVFGTFIAEMRKEKGLTQQNLADQLHVTDKAVSKWERGLCYPDLTLMEPLAARRRTRWLLHGFSPQKSQRPIRGAGILVRLKGLEPTR